MKAASSRRGAVLLIVLLAMAFAAAAFTFFLERSTPDLLVEKREAAGLWMRRDAEGALESTLGVLAAYRTLLGDLHHPSEGWGDPLPLSGFEPEARRKVAVRVLDDSGRIPLVNTEYSGLVAVFQSWGMSQREAERCADSLLLWTRKDYTPVTLLGSEGEEYRNAEVPFKAPAKPLRSYEELRTIAIVREVFFDEAGLPTAHFERFVRTFSLLDYKSVNINAAVPELFVSRSGLGTASAGERLSSAKSAQGTYSNGLGYFRSTDEAVGSLGQIDSIVAAGVSVNVLRIEVTVREGDSEFRLSALVAPSGQASWPAATLASASSSSTGESSDSATNTGKLKYPFEVLEITQHDGRAFNDDLGAAAVSP